MSTSDVTAQENIPAQEPQPSHPPSIQDQFERLRSRISRVSGAKRVYTTKADRLEELRRALIEARIAHNRSHADIAARVGVCRQTVARWETREGFRQLRLSQALDWADYLGVSFEF